MKAKTFGLVAVFLAASLWAILFIRAKAIEAGGLRAETIAIQAKQQTAGASIRSLRVKIDGLDRERATLQAEFEAMPKVTVTQVAAAESRKPDALITREDQLLDWLKKEREEQKRPERQLFELAIQRGQLAVTYGLLFRDLQLSSETIEKFKDNAIRRYETQMDLLALMQAHGLDHSDPGMAKLWSQMGADYYAAQQALLGEAGFRSFQEYERRAPVRDMMGSLAGAATVTGIPFTQDQTEQLVEVMAKTNSDYLAGRNAQPISINWELVDAYAKTILSDEQFAFFRTANPPGGGGSRVWSKFDRAVNDAIRADEKPR